MPESDELLEKGRHNWKGKHSHDPISGIIGGLILILVGVLFLLSTVDVISWSKWWAYFLLGLGSILILEVIIRSATPAYRRRGKEKLIGGAVLMIIGGTNIFGMGNWWPLIIIAVGAILIFSSLRGIKR